MANHAVPLAAPEDQPPGELIVGPWPHPDPEPEPDDEPEPLPPAAVAIPRCDGCDWPTHGMVVGNIITGHREWRVLTHAQWVGFRNHTWSPR